MKREDCSRIAKFWVNTMSHGHRSGDVDDVQRLPRFAQRGHNLWRIIGYDIEANAQLSQWKHPEEPRTKKARQFRSNVKVLFTVFSIAIAWCIMNSCHKVVWSIRNTTLKLCTDCAKQFVRNQSWILLNYNLPAYTSKLVHEFLAKIKTVIIP